MKKFSIILNSRKRVELLHELFQNIIEKTSNLDEIEIIVSFDSDDIESLAYVFDISTYHQIFSHTESRFTLDEEFRNKIRSLLRFEFRQRDRELIKSYNRMVTFATGEFIFVLNDDARIETQDWDKIAWENLKGHDIIYGATTCTSVDHHPTLGYASFPIISKKACDVLGFFMPPHIKTLGGDVAVFRIFDAIKYVMDLPINIRHLMHESLEKVYHPDETAMELRAITNEQEAFTYDITESANKLLKYIVESKNEVK